MSWLKIDDQVAFHAKTVAAGNGPFGAFVRLAAWSCAQLTDGYVPAAVARTMATQHELDTLVEVRFLDAAERGYQIHNFLEWNPPAEKVRAKREADRLRKTGGSRAGVAPDSARNPNGVASDSVSPVPVPVPVPVSDPIPVPDPTQKKQRGASRPQLPLVDVGEAAVPRDRADEQQVVFDAWVKARREKFKATGTPRLDPERRAAIDAAFELGYGVEELCLAVRGWVFRHDNKHAAKTKGLQWALESAANIDEGIAAARAQSMPDKSGRDFTLAGRLLSEIAEFEADEGQSEAVRSTLHNLRDLLARFRSAPPEQRAEVAREVRAALGARGVYGAMAEVAQ